MRKVFILTLFIFSLPCSALAQINNANIDEIFEAKVIEIVQEKDLIREDGSQSTQQNIRLKGLTGSWRGKEFLYQGISEIDLPSNNIFKPKDKVLVNWSKDINNQDQFFIQNYIRRGSIYLLGLIFAGVIILIGRAKGLRALLSLVVSFLVITQFIIPQIIAGANPLIVALLGSGLILALIIYITEGFNQKTHLAIISVLISLFITFVFSIIFVQLARLTGFSSEEVTFLVGMGNLVDFRGLLLAGILIGALGVLDDAILGQMEAVNQIKKLNPDLSKKEIIKSANLIGRAHLGAMVNTLFLTYAGASLPLLILFSLEPSSGFGLAQAIDNEFIATEIIRTLSGSIGLVLAFPITTIIGTYFLKSSNNIPFPQTRTFL